MEIKDSIPASTVGVSIESVDECSHLKGDFRLTFVEDNVESLHLLIVVNFQRYNDVDGNFGKGVIVTTLPPGEFGGRYMFRASRSHKR